MEQVDLYDLEKEYDSLVRVRSCAMRTVEARLQNLSQEMAGFDNDENFFEISHRLKTFRSVIKKCESHGYALDIATIDENIKDIAGIRIVTDFIDEIEPIRKAIEGQPSMTIIKVKDYIKNPKANGYRSLHLVVVMDVYFSTRMVKIPVEIQIRDKSMDLWSDYEHKLKYKNPNPSPETEQKFQDAADYLQGLSEMAISLRDYNNSSDNSSE